MHPPLNRKDTLCSKVSDTHTRSFSAHAHRPMHHHDHPLPSHPISNPQEAAALVACHADHPVAKFWGVCNDAKHALDACFRREKAVKRCVFGGGGGGEGAAPGAHTLAPRPGVAVLPLKPVDASCDGARERRREGAGAGGRPHL